VTKNGKIIESSIFQQKNAVAKEESRHFSKADISTSEFVIGHSLGVISPNALPVRARK
jgi:hypothetical protein